MNAARAHVEVMLAGMEPGQRCKVEAWLLEEAFPYGWPSIYRNAREAFLSSRIGSAYGTWTCELELDARAYTIGRHEERDEIVYVDPDREHLFKRLEDGTYIPRTRHKIAPID